MAGALTANAVTVRLSAGSSMETPFPLADIQFLSPVEGANNVLLTGVVMISEGEDPDEVTFQWCRCFPGNDVLDDLFGSAVGDPFVINSGDSVLDATPIVIQAIDRQSAMTTAYVLTNINADGTIGGVTGLYADAVLYD